jgi:hypothetical protein
MAGLPAWKAESAAVFGALIGTLFFLYGIGAVDDWIKVAAGKEVHEADESSWEGGGVSLAVIVSNTWFWRWS